MKKIHISRLPLVLGLALAVLGGANRGLGQSSDARAAHRQALVNKLPTGVAVIPSQHFGPRGTRDSADFYYLTGFAEPDAVLVIWPLAEQREVVFTRSGKAPSSSSLPARPSSELRMFLLRAAMGQKVWLPFTDLEGLGQWLGSPNPLTAAEEIRNLDPLLAELRIVKSPEEIRILQKAIDITADAFVEALRAAQPGMRETDLAAIFHYSYARRGAASSFLQAASGPNSTSIHFGATEREMKAGDMVVFDVGAWVDKYTSDISRTIPVSGKFTPAQAEIYGAVLKAQAAGIRLMVPGTIIQKAQDAAENVLVEELAKLGLVTDPASPWQRRLYIQHGFGHGIGLDVHDVWGWYSRAMKTMAFRPGMVITFEPGVYFATGGLEKALAAARGPVPEAEKKAFLEKVGPVYKKYAGMGCRIEDDVLVTETGNQILSARAPKEIPEIEKIMKSPSPFNQIK